MFTIIIIKTISKIIINSENNSLDYFNSLSNLKDGTKKIEINGNVAFDVKTYNGYKLIVVFDDDHINGYSVLAHSPDYSSMNSIAEQIALSFLFNK